MNILHIYKDYYPVLGGIENHVRVLAEAGVARGHDRNRARHQPRSAHAAHRTERRDVDQDSRWINVLPRPSARRCLALPGGWAQRRCRAFTFSIPAGRTGAACSAVRRPKRSSPITATFAPENTARGLSALSVARPAQSRSAHCYQRTLHRHVALLEPVQVQMPHHPAGDPRRTIFAGESAARERIARSSWLCGDALIIVTAFGRDG